MSAVIPAPYTFGVLDAGAAEVTGFVLRQSGTQSITATDASNPALSGTFQLSVLSPPVAVPDVSGAAFLAMAGILAALGTRLSWRGPAGN